MTKVLLVEDDESVARPLRQGLERHGFAVHVVGSGEDALRAPRADVVLLDLGLPGIDGFDVCRRLRATSDVPIIVVSARAEEVDRVVGLEMGADDYVVKPFGFRELVARIRAVLRRTAARAPEEMVLAAGPLSVDRRTRRVFLNDSEVALTPKEFDVLAELAGDPGAARSRRDILEAAWGTHWIGPTKTLDVHVASIRRKLGDPRWIETVRGVGFRLRVPA